MEARRVPVIALTRRNDLKTKLEAFEQGVDDVLALPFAPEELLARVVAITRRAHRMVVPISPVLKVADLEIDIMNRKVRSHGHELHLTTLEMNLFYLLVANARTAMSRDEIMEYLWGADYAADSNVVDRHIRNLRLKLRNDWRRPKYIFTVPGRGYSFLRPAARGEQ